ncbi:MAG: G8 domain-containing protein [Ferruginibacter sp.]
MIKNLFAAVFCFFVFTVNSFAQALYDFTIFNTANTPVFAGVNFKAVGVGKGGYTWAGTQYQGLYRYNPVAKTWEKYNEGLTNVFISDIKTDRKGGIWISQAGTSGQQGGGSNIAGGVNYFKDTSFSSMNFYSITSGGGLTSRNARSLWIDTNRNTQDTLPRTWVAQGTYITSSVTTAGGISVGLNNAANYFSKIYQGLQVTPYVSAPNAGTPNCIAVAGNATEVWVFALTNFGKSQILRYRTDAVQSTFIGAYDNTTTPLLSAGLRANAMYFDGNNKKWLGLSNGGLIIKDNSSWKFMNDTTVFPTGTAVNANAITSDQNGNILIGTNSGLVIYYSGPVDSASSYKRLTTLNGLPSNNINHIAIDTANERIVLATDAGVVFMKQRKTIDVKLVWDHSFPNPGIKPKGVVADGVARLYVKVKKINDTLPSIKKVQLQINNYSATFQSLRGKLRKADTLDKYSAEANTGTATDVNRTDSASDGSFWFWYVAPEDFCKSPGDKESKLAERTDSVKVKVTYSNNAEDSAILEVKVVRPPVVYSALARRISNTDLLINSSNSTGKVLFKGSTPTFVGSIGSAIGSSKMLEALGFDKIDFEIDISKGLSQLTNLFLAKPPLPPLNIPPAFQTPLSSTNYTRKNLLGVIYQMRLKGFACNQADYVGHGPAVSIMQAAVALKPKEFYANNPGSRFNNFGKGFLHKVITINAPLLKAPIFDMLTRITKLRGELMKSMIRNLSFDAGQQYPYDFFKTEVAPPVAARPAVPGTPLGIMIGSSPLINDLFRNLGFSSDSIMLAIGSLPMDALKNLSSHFIVSNAVVPAQRWDLIPFPKAFPQLTDGMLINFRDGLPGLKGPLTQLFDSSNSAATRAMKFLDLMHAQYGFANFSQNSDFFLPLNTMTGGLPVSQTNISLFNNSLPDSFNAMHLPMLGRTELPQRLAELFNSGIKTPLFIDSIPANRGNLYKPPVIVEKPTGVRYDTSKVVIDSRGTLSTPTFRDTLVQVKYRVKDTTNLQYIYISFQDTSYTTLNKNRNQQVNLRIKSLMEYSGPQQVASLAVYERTDSILYYVDTLSAYVLPPDSIQDFRVTEQEVELTNGVLYTPYYQVKVKGKWETLPNDNKDIIVTLDDNGNATFDTTKLSFDATGDGFARAMFQYKQFKDTVDFTCELSILKTAVNKTISSGSFKNPAIWSKGWAPQPQDSVVIVSGHAVTLDTTVQIQSLKIENLASLTLNDASKKMQLGADDDGDFMIDNNGTLNIGNGTLTVKGRVKFNSGAAFNMTGGNLVIDGNTGNTITSLQNGLYLFEAATGMQSFSFTGGTLQIIDPPIGVASQAINCPYSFGINSTLILGNGISLTASANPNGFGGSQFPPQIGKLILDAGTKNGNRQLTITKPLNVKGSFEIRTGSNLVLNAAVNVTN